MPFTVGNHKNNLLNRRRHLRHRLRDSCRHHHHRWTGNHETKNIWNYERSENTKNITYEMTRLATLEATATTAAATTIASSTAATKASASAATAETAAAATASRAFVRAITAHVTITTAREATA